MMINLIRHNKTLVEPGTIAGSTDCLAHDLDAGQIRFLTDAVVGTQIIVSPAQRCQRLAQNLGLKVDRYEPLLWEQDFGAWEGRRWADIGPDHLFWTDPATARPPQGESFADVIERAQAIDLPEANVTLLCHAGMIRAFLARALHLSAAQALKFEIDHASLTLIQRYKDQSSGESWSVKAVNRRV